MPNTTTPTTMGIKISAKQIREPKARAITRHDWHGEWNYTLTGAPPEP